MNSKRLTGLMIGTMIAGIAVAGAAPDVKVVVNGQTMSFQQPPVERNNRVFVPMRAIFERLGSTVVYQNGVINAQGNGRSVHLTIGSRNATVNDNPFSMDVAPFVIAGRTEVPLRFVAQALGATVNWNAASQTVNIATSAGNVTYTPQPASPVSLTDVSPSRGGFVNTTHPALSAHFSVPVNRDSLHVRVDGRDVTSLVYANVQGFDVTPNFELTPGQHVVSVTGTTTSGASFSQSWSFETAAGTGANFIKDLAPAPGARVAASFTLSGRTLPGSSVHVVASGSASAFGGVLKIETGTFQGDATADPNGYFSLPVSLNAALRGGQVRVVITTKSRGGASYERQVTYAT